MGGDADSAPGTVQRVVRLDSEEPGAGEGQRLFFGCALEEAAKSAIGQALEIPADPGPAHPALRWVPSENWHLTLRFLGTTPGETLRQLQDGLDSLSLPAPFGIRLEEWGAFPRPGRATTLWIGIRDPDRRLAELAAALESLAVRVGFPPERRSFHPHVTIARSRSPLDLRAFLRTLPRIDLTMRITGFTLYRSELLGGPPRYQALRYRPLA